MRLIKNKKGASHVIGYMLVFSITSILVSSFIFATSFMIDQRTKQAVELLADGLADRVADAVMEAVAIKQSLPYINYSRKMDLPSDLAGRSYYIEVTESKIFVNTTDGQVSVNNTNYNLEALNLGISGRVYGSSQGLKVYCDKTDYVYRFDFDSDTSESSGEYGYTRVSTSTNPTSDWPDQYTGWRCRTPIYLYNDYTVLLSDIQVRLELNSFNFDYNQVNRNASDIRFYEPGASPTDRPYWIETWNYNGNSIIWVNVSSLPANNVKKTLYLYHKNPNAAPASNGDETFLFFDDFSDDLSKWTSLNQDGIDLLENGIVNISNKNALISKLKWNYDDVYILEAKALSLPGSRKETQSDREADIFVRSVSDDPFDTSYIFSSGNFTNETRNAAIVKQTPGVSDVVVNTTVNPPLSQDWKRLLFLTNQSNLLAYRVDYSTDTWEVLLHYDINNDDGGEYYFGLCNTNEENGAYAYYDWVYLRKPGAMVYDWRYLDIYEPMIDINVGAVQSLDYYWDNDPLASLERGWPNYLRGDFVYHESFGPDAMEEVEQSDVPISLTFNIGGIKPDNYSVSVILGDVLNDTDNISVYANDDPKLSGLSSNAGEYIEKWFFVTVTESEPMSGTGILKIKFCSSGSIIPVCALTIERGVKGIKIGAG